ncbi:hypothetical protein DIPPA_10152 [Diplonema papillatum]|nr:hypothetical protein DIPPA_10152 [Diplonema papillatum]
MVGPRASFSPGQRSTSNAEADRYNAAAAGFVTAEAELLASHTITHLAGQTAADRAAVAQALAREAKALDACRDTHRTDLAIKRSKYVQSSSAAERTHAKPRAFTLLAAEAVHMHYYFHRYHHRHDIHIRKRYL